MKNKTSVMILAFLCFMNSHIFAEKMAISGGKIIDISNFGNSRSDIENSLILIEDSKITYAGGMRPYKIGEMDRIIDVSGKYIIPGLIDGFAALDNQSFASSYLYMGVTSIIGVYGGRRAEVLFGQGSPGPNIIKWKSLGDSEDRKPDIDSYLREIEKMACSGVRVVLLMYEFRPDELKATIKKAHSLGMAAVGELGFTSYAEAIKAGINALIHSTRYTMEIAPPEMRKAVAADPFGKPASDYMKWLADMDSGMVEFREYARCLGLQKTGLMPTLMLYAIDLPETENPWNFPIAKILNPDDIHFPLDPLTGKHDYPTESAESKIKIARKVIDLERKYYLCGAKYLAGSGCDVWGTLPGISLHQELFWLTRIGLTPRQALAASTWNFSELLGLKEIGEIKSGKKADLVVLEKNPLEDINNLRAIWAVVHDGKIIDREKLLPLN